MRDASILGVDNNIKQGQQRTKKIMSPNTCGRQRSGGVETLEGRERDTQTEKTGR